MRRLLIGLLLLFAACSGDEGGGAGTVEMTASQTFEPTTITVAAGETVTWTNESGEQHTVTADEGSLPSGADYFDSSGATGEDEAIDDLSAGLVGPGDTYAYTFDTPGTYRYYCIPHRSAGMEGVVVVEASGG